MHRYVFCDDSDNFTPMHTDAVGGDDIDLVLEELKNAQDHLQKANNILENYRHFCRRVSSTP